jgi:hypothetical protein
MRIPTPVCVELYLVSGYGERGGFCHSPVLHGNGLGGVRVGAFCCDREGRAGLPCGYGDGGRDGTYIGDTGGEGYYDATGGAGALNVAVPNGGWIDRYGG